MKIPRPGTASDRPERPAGPARPAVAASLAIAALLALLAPRAGEGPVADAAADGIARASRCDARLAPRPDAPSGRALRAWHACIAAELRTLAGDRVAATGAHFHAWRIAARAARDSAPDAPDARDARDARDAPDAADAADLRDRHGRHVQEALRSNLTSLHRLCTAAGEDCARIGEALAPSS